jgi:hypothetical protein
MAIATYSWTQPETCGPSSCAFGSPEEGETPVATTDGGADWTQMPLPGGISSLLGVACPGVSECYAATGSIILSTTDGGTTWNTDTIPSGTSPWAITCVTTTNCYAADSNTDTDLLETTDGTTWSARPTPYPGAIFPTALSCPATGTCFIAGNDPITNSPEVIATSGNGGYWVADALGKVFTFGDAPADGDMSGTHLNGPIIAASGS